MCGIAGILLGPGAGDMLDPEAARADLAVMTRSLVHRGPDGDGTWIGAGAALGHRRLAILDLVGGIQPMSSEDGDVVACFNGEIYNHHELRAGLEARGHRFRTRSDTEVLVHGFREWGAGLCERLDGMFAFLVHDRASGETLLARDPIGKKPLFTASLDGRILVASEARALLSLPGFPRRLRTERLGELLALRYLPGTETLLADLDQLAPGHRCLHRPGEALHPTPFWRLEPGERPRDFEAAVLELRERFEAAVTKRLEADVPLGAFLSGGVDSSGVVHAMHRRRPDLRAVTVGFDDPRFDERPHARALAERLGLGLDEELLRPDPDRDLPRLAELCDLPLHDSSAWPTLLVCAAARRHVTVALTGDGGDEGFGGYRRHRFDLLEQGLRWIPRPLARLAGALYPKADRMPRPFRLKRTLQDLGVAPAEAYFRSVSALLPDEVEALCGPGTGPLRHPYAGLREAWARTEGDHTSRVLALDLHTYLPGDILVKTDRCSMQHSLELRSPLLDPELLRFAAGLPVDWKLDRRGGKKVLKAAFAPWLGEAFLARPKQGFSIPLADWLRGPLRPARDAAIAGDFAGAFLDRGTLRRLAGEHDAGRRDRSEALWAVLMLEQWNRRWGKVT